MNVTRYFPRGRMTEERKCPICGVANVSLGSTGRDAYAVNCPICGSFEITGPALASGEHLFDGEGNRHRLSAVTRSSSDRGTKVIVDTYNAAQLIEAAVPSRTLLEAVDRLLLYLDEVAASPAKPVKFNPPTDYPILTAADGHEAAFYLKKAGDFGFVEVEQGNLVRLDRQGWDRLIELRRTRVVSDQAFIAMWFDSSMQEALDDGIIPGVEAAGYRPLRIDFVEHNERIDDRIMAEIRRSGLMIADFTGHRGGVYFEAGFAEGLGVPVVRTCRSDAMEELHFDIRQYNHIVWSTPEELKEKLTLRIEASVPVPGSGLATRANSV